MLTAHECRAKAKELSGLAEETENLRYRDSLVWMSRCWEDMAVQADWQDGDPHSAAYRAD